MHGSFRILKTFEDVVEEFGGKAKEHLHPVEAVELPSDRLAGEVLREATRKKDVKEAVDQKRGESNAAPQDTPALHITRRREHPLWPPP